MSLIFAERAKPARYFEYSSFKSGCEGWPFWVCLDFGAGWKGRMGLGWFSRRWVVGFTIAVPMVELTTEVPMVELSPAWSRLGRSFCGLRLGQANKGGGG
jgi:hypothetical protein